MYELEKSCGAIWRQEKSCTLNVESTNNLIRSVVNLYPLNEA